jgi:hypothetical protein
MRRDRAARDAESVQGTAQFSISRTMMSKADAPAAVLLAFAELG